MSQKLPLSLMLMNMFAGALAVLMLLAAVLLGVLIGLNTARGDTAGNGALIWTAGFFVLGGLGFFGLKKWAQTMAQPQATARPQAPSDKSNAQAEV